MSQPPVPPPPLPPAPPQSVGAVGGVQVRCAGCKLILTVAPGVTEFVCSTCQLPQMLPPELMRVRLPLKPPTPPPPTLPPSQPPPLLLPAPPSHVPAHGIDPTKIQVPCAHCKAILNVPHGLARFTCPQCNVELAVDLTKFKQFFQSQPPPPEEVNEVFLLLPFHPFPFLTAKFNLIAWI
uniref:Zinc finger LSD1-type domain-containing protein n=1 Tax=Fagus sylvatica TaxID=28930 RepID=A0A2N9IKC6_FAGSY